MSRRTAVLIASSKFPNEAGLTSLDAPERDVDALAGVLAADKGGVYDHVVLLKNQPSHAVRVSLNRTLRTAGKDDQVLIYFSGHGKLDPTGRLCLTMTDTVLDALESSALRVAELKDFLDVSRCRNVMLFLDCCYSGAVGKSFTRSSVDDQLQVAAQGAGICIMSASNAVQTALETPESGLGVFTRCIVEGLQSGAADGDGDGLVTFDELFDYVQRKVTAEGHQRPQKWSFQAEGDLLVARTGRDVWEETRKKLRLKILELAGTQDLPGEVVGDALELLDVARREQTDRQRLQVKLLEELAGEGGKVAAFVMGWMKLAGEATRPPVHSEPADKRGSIKILSDLGEMLIEASAGRFEGNSPSTSTPAVSPSVSASPVPQNKITPGRWLIEERPYGVVAFNKYTLDLRQDGSIDGAVACLGFDYGAGGRWTFDPQENLLVLEIKPKTMKARLVSGNRTLKISITKQEGGCLKGRQLKALSAFRLTKIA